MGAANRFLLVLLLSAVAITCISGRKQKQYRINIYDEERYDPHLTDSFRLENTAFQKVEYTPEDNGKYYYDSLQPGHYTFWSRDIFGYKHKIELQLKKDTNIYFYHIYGYDPVPLIPLEELRKADRIDVVWIRSGCFQFDVTKASIVRNENKKTYKVTLTSDGETPLYGNDIKEDLINDVYRMQLESTSALGSGNGMMSTSRSYILLLAGKKLFQLTDVSGELLADPIDGYIVNHINQPFTR